MVEKRQLNIRLPIDIYDKLNNSEGSMIGIIEEALRKHFDTSNVSESSKDVSHLLTEVEYLRSENVKLLELLRAYPKSPALLKVIQEHANCSIAV